MSASPNPQGYAPPPSRSGCGCFGIGCGCAALLLLLCGGAGVALFFMFKDSFTQDPAKVTAIGSSIAELDMPQELDPKFGMDLSVPFAGRVMKAAFYGSDKDASMLMLMEFRLINEDQAKGQITVGGKDEEDKMEVKESHTEMFTIRGHESQFKIEQVYPKGHPELLFWRAGGAFPGHEGTAAISLQLPQSKYSLEQLQAIIRSVK